MDVGRANKFLYDVTTVLASYLILIVFLSFFFFGGGVAHTKMNPLHQRNKDLVIGRRMHSHSSLNGWLYFVAILQLRGDAAVTLRS